MKRKAVGILVAVMLTSLTGCSSQAQATNANNVTEISITTESADVPIESTITEETSSIPESEVEPIYTEYEDLFLADNFSKLNKERLEPVDTDNLEEVNEIYLLSESTDLYNFEGTWMGYSKPDIKVTLFKASDKWAEVSFAEYVLYVPKMSFDLVAMTETDANALLAQAETSEPKVETPKEEKSKTPAPTEPVVVEPSTTEPVVVEPETPVVDNTKYTPEEAIAVYRSIIEANGISWNPALKNGGSWGTGWIYLKKGQPELAGNNSVESHRMGDGDGILWDCYYLEVTGSDENAVYYTKWHP